MKTLVLINLAKNCGSTGRIAELIGKTAIKNGWDCYFVHGARYDRPSELKNIRVGSIIDNLLHFAVSFLFDAQGCGSVLNTRRLVRKLRQIHPDIVHIHNIHGSYINYRILFKYLREEKIKVVWTLHDCWAFTGHCTYFDRIGCEKWTDHCHNCPQIHSYPVSLFLDRSYCNFKSKKKAFDTNDLVLVPVSHWLEDLCRKSFLSGHRAITIHNGIDLDVFKQTHSDFRKKHNLIGKFIILGVADGYGDRKGFEEFLQMGKDLDNDCQIVLIGVEKEKMSLIPDNIIAVGRTKNQQELVEIYSAADVYVNPTYEDNFPTTNIEALACGTPVITYDTGGSPEAIDEHTGICVEKGNYRELLNAIDSIRLKGSSSFRDKCRKRAETQFDHNICYKKYIELFNDLT